MSEAEVAVWCSTLAAVPFEGGIAAVRALRENVDWLPTHHQLIEEAQVQARRLAVQQRERELGAPSVCARCDNSGWLFVETTSGAEAVRRCSCRAGAVPDEHPPRCNCGVCRYGAKRADRIRLGLDLGYERRGADPLRLVHADDALA